MRVNKMLRKDAPIKYLLVSAFLALCFGCAASPAIDSKPEDRFIAGDKARDNLASNILLALSDSDSPIRVNYEGTCIREYQDRFAALIFPQINMTAPQEEGTDVERVRSIFLNEEKVSIAQGEDSIIRVRIGEPDDEILETRIESLTFETDARFNGIFAIGMIGYAREVVAAAEKRGVKHAYSLTYSGILFPPFDEYPHLPETLEDVTMGEALDLVAMTLEEIVIYGACSVQFELHTYQRNKYEDD